MFLILHDIRNLDFLKTCSDFGIMALTAFNRNASDVNGGICQYEGVNSVLLES